MVAATRIVSRGEKQICPARDRARAARLLRVASNGGAALAPRSARAASPARPRLAEYPPNRLRELLTRHSPARFGIADGDRQALREREHATHQAADDPLEWRHVMSADRSENALHDRPGIWTAVFRPGSSDAGRARACTPYTASSARRRACRVAKLQFATRFATSRTRAAHARTGMLRLVPAAI